MKIRLQTKTKKNKSEQFLIKKYFPFHFDTKKYTNIFFICCDLKQEKQKSKVELFFRYFLLSKEKEEVND